MKVIVFAIFLAIAVLTASAAEKARFDNYRVYRVLPRTQEHINLLHSLEAPGHGLDFWSEIGVVNQPVDIMVAPHKIADFLEIMERFSVKNIIMNQNVQNLIDEESKPSSKLHGRTPYADVIFEKYNDLDVIYKYLYKKEKENPKTVKVVVGGKSYEGRNITGVKISYKTGNKAIFIEAGIHAREWIAPATALYILDQLLTSTDSDVRQLAENYDWYIFPSFNPDGYEYTRNKNRMWRKTRQPYGTCVGADGNRNWDFHWMDGGASSIACMDTYAGKTAFSEVETKTMSEYITSVSSHLLGYISFHSYSQLLLLPYGHTDEHLDNFDDLFKIGNAAATSLKKKHGTLYTVGNIVEVLYVASGGSMDWVKGVHKVPITYTYELRDTGHNGFVLPPEQIIPNGEEILDSIVTMFKEAEKLGYK